MGKCAICHPGSKRPADGHLFFGKEIFRNLIRCNGIEDIIPGNMTAGAISTIRKLIDKNVIIQSENSLGSLESYQRYKVYESKYIEKVQWAITPVCNYKCKHCEVSAPGSACREMTLEQCKYVISEIERAGIRSVTITGGEPLIRKDLEEIIACLAKSNIALTKVYTNGALLNDKTLDMFEQYGMHPNFQISFDGVGYHDWLRGVDGAQEQAIRAFALLKTRQYVCSCAMMLHKKNMDSIEDTVQLLAKYGVQELSINAPKKIGLWEQYAGDYALTEDEVWKTYKKYIPRYFHSNMPVTIAMDGYFACRKGSTEYIIPYIRHYKNDADFQKIPCCSEIYTSMYIGPDGTISPCMSFSCFDSITRKMPNILVKSMSEITLNSAYSEIASCTVADLLASNEECMLCDHKDKCCGGCFAQYITDDGAYKNIDKRTCYFYKNIGEGAVREVADTAIIRTS